MSIFLKPFAVLVISCLIFAGAAWLINEDIFDFVQTGFYNPSIVKLYIDENKKDANLALEFILELQEKFANTLYEPAVRSSFLYNQGAEDIFQRSRIYGILMESTTGLQSVQFIDANGIRIHFSTSLRDIILQNETSVSYRNYTEDPLALPYEIVSVSANGHPVFTMDEESDRIIFSYPFNDSMDVYHGTALFTVSIRALSEKMVAEGRLKVNENISVIGHPPGVLFGTPVEFKREMNKKVSEVWDDAGADGIKDRITIDSESSGSKFSLISVKAHPEGAEDKYLLFGRLVNDNLFYISDSMKLILYISIFLTFYLALFFIINFKPGPVTIVRNRIRRLRDTLFEQLYEDKSTQEKIRWLLELEQRRDEVKTELKSKLKISKKTEKNLDEIIDKSWDEIIGIVRANSGHAALALKIADLDVKEIVKKAQTANEAIKEDKEAVKIVETIEEVEVLEEVEEAESLDEVETLEDIEEAEALEEVDEAEILEDIEEAESLEEVDEAEILEDIEEGEALEEVDEAEPLEEVETLEDIEEAESLEEVDTLEDIEEAEALEEVDTLEDIEEAESLEEIDEAEALEDIEEIVSLEDIEEAESLEEIDEVESLEEVETLENIEEAEALEEVDEAESLDEAEPLDVVEEAEATEVGKEAEAAEIAEKTGIIEEIDDFITLEEEKILVKHAVVEKKETMTADESAVKPSPSVAAIEETHEVTETGEFITLEEDGPVIEPAAEIPAEEIGETETFEEAETVTPDDAETLVDIDEPEQFEEIEILEDAVTLNDAETFVDINEAEDSKLFTEISLEENKKDSSDGFYDEMAEFVEEVVLSPNFIGFDVKEEMKESAQLDEVYELEEVDELETIDEPEEIDEHKEIEEITPSSDNFVYNIEDFIEVLDNFDEELGLSARGSSSEPETAAEEPLEEIEILDNAPAESVIEELASEESVIEELALEESVIEELALEESVIEELALEESVIEELASEESVIEELLAEEINIEEIIIDESVAESIIDEVPALTPLNNDYKGLSAQAGLLQLASELQSAGKIEIFEESKPADEAASPKSLLRLALAAESSYSGGKTTSAGKPEVTSVIETYPTIGLLERAIREIRLADTNAPYKTKTTGSGKGLLELASRIEFGEPVSSADTYSAASGTGIEEIKEQTAQIEELNEQTADIEDEEKNNKIKITNTEEQSAETEDEIEMDIFFPLDDMFSSLSQMKTTEDLD